jgi:hypothetical protein
VSLFLTTEATKTEVGRYFIANDPPFSQGRIEALPHTTFANGWLLISTDQVGT